MTLREINRVWSDYRVDRLVSQLKFSLRVYNEAAIARVVRFVRDDYEEVLAQNKLEEARKEAVFFDLLSRHTNYMDTEEERKEEREGWNEWFWGSSQRPVGAKYAPVSE